MKKSTQIELIFALTTALTTLYAHEHAGNTQLIKITEDKLKETVQK